MINRGMPKHEKSKRAMRVSDFFLSLREQKGWTQRQMAKFAGVSHIYIHQLESGEFKKLPLDTIRALVKSGALSEEETVALMDMLYEEINRYVLGRN